MIVVPPYVRDETEMLVYFQGIEAGIKMAASRLGQPCPGGQPGTVTAQHLLNDLAIFERQALELMRKDPPP